MRAHMERLKKTGFDKFAKPGKFIACVNVVDVLGCDTSITVEVLV